MSMKQAGKAKPTQAKVDTKPTASLVREPCLVSVENTKFTLEGAYR